MAGRARKSSFAAGPSLDRLVRKEVALGAIREKQPPQDHIGLSIAPFMDVDSDDVIFDYIAGGLQDGLAPARAEDAEAELAQKDEMLYGQGRAAIIDWTLKDKYTASDVTRYREALFIAEQTQGISTDLPFNFVGRTQADFEKRLARDDALRRKKLDNRIEWLIMTSLETGNIAYDDGKIKFAVNWGRPANQQDQAPASGLWDAGVDFDPIGDILSMNDFMYDTYGVRLRRAFTSRKVMQSIWKSNRFLQLSGINAVAGGAPIDLNYILPGWGPQKAAQIVQEVTGVTFLPAYDSVYRTRPVGSAVWTNNRFTSDNKIIFLPEPGDLGEIDDTEIGFAKTLTSPHPEGEWAPGWYEWEDQKRDPWLQVRGTGIKAFPVFPYMEYTYVMQVLS